MTRVAGGPDDLADQVLERLAPAIAGPPPLLRVFLLVVCLVQFGLALPWLVGADPLGIMRDASTAHLTRDGALGLAVAIAGLLTAWRPRYAIAAVLVSAAALTAQIATAVIDEHYLRVSLLVEGVHAFTVLITLLVALATRPVTPLAKRQTRLRSIPGSRVDRVRRH